MTGVVPVRAARRTLSQSVTEGLLERIRAGEFRPGDRLPTEKGLMDQYGVGRNAAREAMQALVAMGLIEVRPGRGATLLAVNSSGVDAETITALLSDEAVENLYEFRRLLEVETAARAAERATDADVEEMKAVLARWRRAAGRSPNGEATGMLDDEFHAAIASASHNPLYVTMLGTVSHLICRGRQLAVKNVPWAVKRARTEHAQILDAIEARDPERAAECMRVHLDGAIEAVRAGLHPGGKGPNGARR